MMEQDHILLNEAQVGPRDWLTDMQSYLSKKPNASDDELFKQFPQLNKDGRRLDAALSYLHGKEKGMSDQEAKQMYPDLLGPGQVFGEQPKTKDESPTIPKLDFRSPIRQDNASESTAMNVPKENLLGAVEADEQARKVRAKYQPMLEKSMNDIMAHKDQFVTSNKPALDFHPDAPDNFYDIPNTKAIDEYLKANYPDAETRYYLRNRILSSFQQNRDQYNVNKIAQKHIDQLPSVQQARQELNTDLSKPEDTQAVLARAAQIDPNLEAQINDIGKKAAQSNYEIKNEVTRSMLNNSTSLVYDENGNLKKVNPLDQNTPFHDQITGAGKALQGVLNFSGDVGQMASGIMKFFGAKEPAYNLQTLADQFKAENAMPEGQQTWGEWLGGQAVPMMLQGEAMGRVAQGLGSPAFRVLAGVQAKGLIGRMAQGALGGIALAPINSALISHDYYTSLLRAGEAPEIAHAKAERVFDKNLVTDMTLSPLQFGIMNAPVSGVGRALLQYGLSPVIAGGHFMLQDYFQQQENNPALTAWQYATSEEGLKTGLAGAMTGMLQHFVIGKMNDWQNAKNVKDAFSFGRKDSSPQTRALPNNNVLASTVLNAFEMKDNPKRAGELSGLVDDLHEKGVYNDQEATKIKGIIRDVAAVKDQVPKMGTSAQRMAVFNELLNKKGYADQLPAAGNDAVADMLNEKMKESDERIKKIMNEEEPLYFINGIETRKDQLLGFANENPAAIRTAKIDVIGDPETQTAIRDIASKPAEVMPALKPVGQENEQSEKHGQSNIIEVRHGLTQEDVDQVTSGNTDIKMNQAGKLKVDQLGNELEGKGVTNIVGSSTARSLQMIRTLADRLNVPHQANDGLQTWDIGDFAGMEDDKFDRVLKFFVDHPDEKEFEGKKLNESFNEYKDRVLQARQQIEDTAKPGTLVVNHSKNMMLWDAFQKQGEWNEAAKKDFLNAEAPPPAELQKTVGSMIDRRVNYKGEEGDLFQEGQRLIFDNGKRQYDIGNVNEMSGQPLSRAELSEPKEQVTPVDKRTIDIDGERYFNPHEDPTDAIKRNTDGKITSIELQTANGKKRSFGGPLAQEAAYHFILSRYGEEAETQLAKDFDEAKVSDAQLLAGLQSELAKLNLQHLYGKSSEAGPIAGDGEAGDKSPELLSAVREDDAAKAGTGTSPDETKSQSAADRAPGFVRAPGEAEGHEPIQNESGQTAENLKHEEELKADLAARLGKKLDRLASETVQANGKENTAGQYLTKAKAVLTQLFPDHDIRAYKTEADYMAKEGRPAGSAGVYDPQGKYIAFNLERIRKAGAENTIFHEVIHPIVQEALVSKPGAVDTAYSKLVELKDMKGMEAVWAHEEAYRGRGLDTMKVEAITEFLTHVADGRIDPEALHVSVRTKIIDAINKVFKALGIDKVISTAQDIRRLADSIKQAFTDADAYPVEHVLGKRSEAKEGESMDAMIGQPSGDPLEDFVREKLDEYKETSIKKALVDTGGMKDADAQALIDKIRTERTQSPEDIIREAEAMGKAVKRQPILPKGGATIPDSGLSKTLKRWYYDGVDDVSDWKSIIRKNKGNEEFNIDKIYHATRKLVNFWNTIPRVNQMAFMLGVEKPELLANQPQNVKDMAAAYRQRLDDVFTMLKQYAPDLNFIQDYFPHFWEKPDEVRNYMANTLSKAPLEGGKSFMKKRFFETIVSGLQAGYKLSTTNPEEIVRLAEANAWKFKTARDILSDMDKKGLIQMAPLGEGPDGWQTVKDPAFQNMAMRMKSYKTGDSKMAALYMPPDVANRMNDYLSKGLQGPVKTVVQQYNNIKNLFQLGVGFFHVGTTTTDALVTGMTNGIQKLTAGNPKGLIDIATLGNLPATVIRGFKAKSDWNKGIVTADTQALKDVNARVGRQKMYSIDAKYNMMKAFGRLRADGDFKQIPKLAWNAMLFLPEAINKPLMEHWVPALKVGGYLRSLDAEISARKNMTPAELQNAKQKIWDQMDDRLGQVVYDNVFMNKSYKDLAFMAIRSAGWTGGTIRAVSGGLAELPRSGNRLVQGQGLSQRTAYLIALPMTVGIMGAMYKYLMTGSGPDDWKDYLFPRDGTKNPDGTDHRVDFPSYMKDILAYKEAPVKTALNKTSPLLNEIVELYKNKDFYGEKIYNQDDPIYQKGLDVLKYEGQSMMPFSFKQNKNDTGTFMDQLTTRQGLEQKFGIMPAPKERERTETQNKIVQAFHDQIGTKEEGRTHAEMEQSIARRHLREFIFNGGDYKSASDEWKIAAGIKSKDLPRFIHDSKMDPYERQYKALTPETKVKLWKEMGTDDQAKYVKWIPVQYRNQLTTSE